MIKGFSKNVYFIGIGGVSMSALARILKYNGHNVAGSDRQESSFTNSLLKEGIKVFKNHKAENIKGFETIVYTSAISEDNKEIVASRNSGAVVYTRAEALSLVSKEFEKIVAVCGSHGKTTTTSMASCIFKEALGEYCAHIGGKNKSANDNLEVMGKGGIFLTEACEYKDNFLSLSPDFLVVLNIAPDHLDYFKTEENVVKSFINFSNKVKEGGKIIINLDDKNCREVIEKTTKNKKIITFSLYDNSADYYLTEVVSKNGGFKFKVNKSEEEFELKIGGEHNLYNSLASVVLLVELGSSYEKIKSGLNCFSGVIRRYEEVGEINGARVVLDYAHHPDEIKKVIKQARQETSGKVFCLFQPHTYSRTKAFWSDFIYALTQADLVMLYPIYPAREKVIRGVTSKRLAYDIRRLKKTSYYADNLKEHFVYLNYFAKRGDVILVLGAGDIDKFREFFEDENKA